MTESMNKIAEMISIYFDGLFYGDTDKLEQVFLKGSYLYGDIKGQPYAKSLDEYLEGVKNRKSPSEMDETQNMQILSIEVLGQMATARLRVPMLGFNYYDFLSLALIDGEWKIVNKLFVHVD